VRRECSAKQKTQKSEITTTRDGSVRAADRTATGDESEKKQENVAEESDRHESGDGGEGGEMIVRRACVLKS